MLIGRKLEDLRGLHMEEKIFCVGLVSDACIYTKYKRRVKLNNEGWEKIPSRYFISLCRVLKRSWEDLAGVGNFYRIFLLQIEKLTSLDRCKPHLVFYVRFWELPPENESEILFSCYHMKQREKNFTLFLLSINLYDVRCSLSLEICLFVRYHNRAAVFRKKLFICLANLKKIVFEKTFHSKTFLFA